MAGTDTALELVAGTEAAKLIKELAERRMEEVRERFSISSRGSQFHIGTTKARAGMVESGSHTQ